jgi:hypothetical protein
MYLLSGVWVNENRIASFHSVSKVVHIYLSNGRDVFGWNLSNNGLFTIWSMYKTLIQQVVLPEKKINNTIAN